MKLIDASTVRAPRTPRGIALVITLLLLVLLSAFAVAFFTRMSVEQSSANSFADGITTRQLAESAVGAVMGQIREATTVPNGAWATQPGMVRVFGGNPDTASTDQSQPYGYYKLYSSDNMVVNGGSVTSFDPANEVPVGDDWQKQPALWTDLNEPVNVTFTDTAGQEQNAKRYPIMDPTLATVAAGSGGPHDSTNHIVEGYSVEKNDDQRGGGPYVRMPLRWLYVLRDGTLVAPSDVSGDGKTVSFKTGGDTRATPSKTNPIVGRVAFWADDDTCKVNINTAGGYTTRNIDKANALGATYAKNGYDYAGSYWDVPRFWTLFDRGGGSTDPYPNNGILTKGSLALCQPPRNEFQRYPGHPATTSLGIVFVDPRDPNRTPKLSSEQLYNLLPRLSPGGSESGTNRLIAQSVMSSGKLGGDGDFRMDQVMSQKAQRLYSSVDEFFFAAKQNNNTRMTANDYIKSLDASSPDLVEPTELDGYRFFLTAHSRSPELNLYGRPRISMWPVDKTDTKRNATDRLIQFCSTLYAGNAAKEFFFYRTNPYSQSDDLGAGPRNNTLLQYLRTMTDRTPPGFTGSFGRKYTADDTGDRDAIIAEMYDYIRCANLRDGTQDKNGMTQAEVDATKYAPRGVVVPAAVPMGGKTAYGFGRFSTISEISLIFYNSGYVPVDNGREAFYLDPKLKPSKGVKEHLMRAFMALETFNPMHGYAKVSSFTQGTGTGTDEQSKNYTIHKLKWDSGGAPVVIVSTDPAQKKWPINFFPGGVDENKVMRSSGDVQAGRASAGMEGFAHTMYDKYGQGDEGPGSVINTSAQPQAVRYPFQTFDDIRIPVNAARPQLLPTLTLQGEGGGPVSGTVTIKFGKYDLQTIKFSFPAAVIPAPTDAFWYDPGGFAWTDFKSVDPSFSKAGAPVFSSMWGSMGSNANPAWMKRLANRIYYVQAVAPANSSANPWNVKDGGDGRNYTSRWKQLLQPGDTVRSVIPGPADVTDMRTVALAKSGEKELSYDVVDPVLHSDRTVRNLQDDLQKSTTGARGTQTLRSGSGDIYFNGHAVEPKPIGSGTNLTWSWEYKHYTASFGNLVKMGKAGAYPAALSADLPLMKSDGSTYLDGVRTKDGSPGDFDNGIGNLPDGPFCNKPDEGNMRWRHYDTTKADWTYDYPYFQNSWLTDTAMDTFFAPNRQIPSPVAFGSLLVGRKANWVTLCFSPNPIGAYGAGATKDFHRGRDVEPKDHLLLDLFTMPVVEPYAISEPFSTAGKINLNQQIVPFSYIHRTTALRAALHPLRITAVPANTTEVTQYKSGISSVPLTKNYRYLLDRDETVKSIMAVLEDPNQKAPHFYRSATQICERFLYPKMDSAYSPITSPVKWSSDETQIKTFWKANGLTGDNVREKPYADLYPRITTKSNSFTVHVRVQKLRPAKSGPGAKYDEFTERPDSVAAEYRGETQIERYLDPSDRRFDKTAFNDDQHDPTTIIDVDRQSIEPAYHFRVVHSKRFAPTR